MNRITIFLKFNRNKRTSPHKPRSIAQQLSLPVANALTRDFQLSNRL